MTILRTISALNDNPFLTPETFKRPMPLTVKQTAALLGMHEMAVQRAIRQGLLKAGRFGGWTYAIDPRAIREYVINHPRPSRVAHVDVHALV